MNAFIVLIACLVLSAHGLPSSQIVGGVNAPDGLYPFQASLRIDGNHLCGGAIISETYVITVAHCVYNIELYKLDVAVGSNYLDNPGAVYRTKNIKMHAGYNKLLKIHDIALIQVSGNITFNENVQPIPLPINDRDDYEDYPLMVTGWGRLSWTGPIPNHLQEIMVKGYERTDCNERYQGIIKESQICTYLYGYGTMCYGDSGGPLIDDGVLVGLASFGRTPCGSESPDVFTRVFYYKSWIDQHTEN